MCGIIGYIGNNEAASVILDGLQRLEYRGYDSAGIAVLGDDGKIAVRRAEGKLEVLKRIVAKEPIKGKMGIGHTRWATHGRPSEANAHPHQSGNIFVVHNGIIENYIELGKFLTEEGYEFTSETDTEVICHLINYFHKKKGLATLDAVRETVLKLRGSYAVVVLDSSDPEKLYVLKKGSPLVLGESDGERFVASDIPALLPYTKEMIFLEDGDHAVVTSNSIEVYGENNGRVVRKPKNIPWSPLMAERGGYKHFMLKEIFEQPQAIEDTLSGRIDYRHGAVALDEISSIYEGGTPAFDRIVIVACGTSWHAGMVGKYMIESLARVPVTVDLSSEFRYREPLVTDRFLILPISQSGETADTLAAQSLAREMGARVMAICNVVGSSLSRAADAVLYTHAGPEIGVASTKAFTSQLVALYLFAIDLACRLKRMDAAKLAAHLNELMKLPRFMKEILAKSEAIRRIANKIEDSMNVLFIGRGANYPVALEGALKLKEISYVHAEGFAAGELKHGPIALIDQDVPVVTIAPKDATYEKMLSNIEEVRARGAKVIALATDGDEVLREKADEIVFLPKTNWCLTSVLASIPLQLLAYYVADIKGTDVDQPRNLAKSVTVE